MPSLRFRSNRSFFLRVALPVLLVTMSALAMANYSLQWASESIDQAAEKRQAALINMVVNKLKARIAHDQESVTIWDDAVVNTAQKPDPEWIDSNLGSWMHSYFGHDELYVIDGKDKPVYAFRQEGVVAPERFSAVAPITVPMAERFREKLRQATSTAEDGAGKTRGLAEFVFVNQRPAILSLKPILPDSGAPELLPVPGQEYLHVALRYLDGDVLKEIGGDYRISSLRFSKRLPESNQAAYADLRTGSGGFLGYFIWEPIRPGSDFMQQIRPVIYAINSAIFVLVLAMLGIQYFRMKADERNRKRIEFLALHDNLTGLPNRHSFDRDLDSLLKAANTSAISVGFLDLDRFKLVNDTLGHEAGDYVIAEAGRRIKGQLGAGGSLYRIGGDEFMIIALIPTSSMLLIAERIVNSVEQPMYYSDNVIQVGVSIGIACWPEHGADRTTLARKADRALYSAKGMGRGRAVLFVPKMDMEIASEQPIRDDLRRSLAQSSELMVTLRPVTSRDTDDVIAVDMDVRWDHPEHGSFAIRNLFDRIANDHGLTDALGRHVFAEAIQLALQIPYARILVPISKQQLRQPSFPLVLTSLLEKVNLPSSRFVLDLGESPRLCEEPECQKTMGLLGQLGLHLMTAGLPAKYQGVEQLRAIGMDFLRIDAGLVQTALADKGAETLVRAMIEIARENRMTVLAEGVDRIDSLLFLTECGCDAFQGAVCSGDLGLADLVHRAGSAVNSAEIGIVRGI